LLIAAQALLRGVLLNVERRDIDTPKISKKAQEILDRGTEIPKPKPPPPPPLEKKSRAAEIPPEEPREARDQPLTRRVINPFGLSFTLDLKNLLAKIPNPKNKRKSRAAFVGPGSPPRSPRKRSPQKKSRAMAIPSPVKTRDWGVQAPEIARRFRESGIQAPDSGRGWRIDPSTSSSTRLTLVS
jgi:hypothetical protein